MNLDCCDAPTPQISQKVVFSWLLLCNFWTFLLFDKRLKTGHFNIAFSLHISLQISHSVFCIISSNFSSLYYSWEQILIQNSIVMINPYFAEKHCVKKWGHLQSYVSTSQTNAHHLCERVIYWSMVSTHLEKTSLMVIVGLLTLIIHLENIINWIGILFRWVKDCVWPHWMSWWIDILTVWFKIGCLTEYVFHIWLCLTQLKKEFWWAADWQFTSLILVWN